MDIVKQRSEENMLEIVQENPQTGASSNINNALSDEHYGI